MPTHSRLLAVLITFCCLLASAQADEIRKVFRKVKDAVVVIRTISTQIAPTGRRQLTDFQGLGSGSIITKKGQILTAAHVIQTAEEIEVELADGRIFPARIISSEPLADLALLQLEDVIEELPTVSLGDSDAMEVGDQVMVVGAPYGATHTLTVGHLSAKRKQGLNLPQLAPLEFLQTDAVINQGNSGGPVFNLKGEIVGVVSHILSKSGGYEGLGFAVSSSSVQHILLEGAHIWSGLEAALVEGELAHALNLPQEAGFLVQSVTKGSISARIGLRGGTLRTSVEDEFILLGGDIILTCQGVTIESIESTAAIREQMKKLKSGSMIRLKVLRGGEEIELKTPYFKTQ